MSCGITLQVDVPSSPHYLTTIHHYQKRKGHLLRWLKRIPPFLRIINHHSTIYQYKPPLSPCWFATKTSISLVDFPFSPDRPKPLRSRWALYDGWSECQGKRPRRTAFWMVTRCRKTVWFAIATPKKQHRFSMKMSSIWGLDLTTSCIFLGNASRTWNPRWKFPHGC